MASLPFCGIGGFGPTNGVDDLTFCFENAVLFAPLHTFALIVALVALVRVVTLPKQRPRSRGLYVLYLFFAAARATLAVALVIASAVRNELNGSLLLAQMLAAAAWIAMLVSHVQSYRRGQEVPLLLKIYAVLALAFSIVQTRSAALLMKEYPRSVEAGGAIAALVMHIFAALFAVIPHRPSMRALIPLVRGPEYGTFKDVMDVAQVKSATEDDRPTIGAPQVHLTFGGFLKRIVSHEVWLVVPGLILSLVSAISNLITTALTGRVMDQVRLAAPITQPFIGLVVVMVVHAFAMGLSHSLLDTAGSRMAARLKLRLFNQLLEREIAFFDGASVGVLINRLTVDCRLAVASVDSKMGEMLSHAMICVGSLVYLFVVSWKMTLLMLVPLPVLAIILLMQLVLFARMIQDFTDRSAAAGRTAEEALRAFATVRLACMEGGEAARYRCDTEWAFDVQWRMSLLSGVSEALMHMAVTSAIVLSLWSGVQQVLAGGMTPGHLVSYVMFALDVIVYLGIFPALFGAFTKDIAVADRIFRIIDGPLDVHTRAPGSRTVPNDRPVGLSLENVMFRYPARDDKRPALDGCSLVVQPGQMAALVGASGSGKSTVLALVQRFYDPDLGVVRASGEDLTQVDGARYREMIGVVAQEPVLFTGTIAENIAYGGRLFASVPDVAADDFPFTAEQLRLPDVGLQWQEIIEAAQRAQALQLGLDRRIGERGAQLSGGEKQRVAIARAIFRAPRLLLLDEATSALDAENEAIVRRSLERLMERRQDMTTLVVAHRLSTIQSADVIYVLCDGRVVEHGSHDQLVQLRGEYWRLLSRQMHAAQV